MVLELFASFVTIITGLPMTRNKVKGYIEDIVKLCGEYYNIIADISFVIGIILFILFLVRLILDYFRKRLGTHKIPISYNTLIIYIITKLFHSKYEDLETAFCRLSNEAIRSVKKKDDIKELKNVLAPFFAQVGQELEERYNVNFSINYKSFFTDDGGGCCLLPEAADCSYQPKEHLYRYNDFVYSLNSNENKGKISDYICTAQEQNKPDGTKDRRIGNNIFFYLFRNPETTEYITNDLEKEEKEGNFFTGSLNYPLFYKSLAVFPIRKLEPPKKSKKKEEKKEDPLLGFLIIDAPQKGVFVEKEFKKIGDLLKNNILKIYDKYEQI